MWLEFSWGHVQFKEVENTAETLSLINLKMAQWSILEIKAVDSITQ